MRLTIATGMPAASLLRRAAPWLLIVAVLAAGITLCLVYGRAIVPFFGPSV